MIREIGPDLGEGFGGRDGKRDGTGPGNREAWRGWDAAGGKWWIGKERIRGGDR